MRAPDAAADLRVLSEIATSVLPHDLLVMTSHDRAGRTLIEASSRDDWPRGMRLDAATTPHVPGDVFAVVDDRKAHPLILVDASGFMRRIRLCRYRSMLSVGLPVPSRRLVLTFCSAAPVIYTTSDLVTARTIARHLARPSGDVDTRVATRAGSARGR